MYKKRLITDYLMSLFEHFPVVAILGARQVGKSTLIENLTIDGLKTYVFDPILDQYGEKKDPEFFLQQQSFPLFLDEFQYAPGLSGVIKRFVDKEKKNGLILLSGSHQFSVIKNLSDSMAGRVAIVNLWPMSVKEITGKNSNFLEELFLNGKIEVSTEKNESKNVIDYLWRGLFPRTLELENKFIPTLYESYLKTYIERDVKDLIDVKNVTLFSRFVALVASKTSNEINYSELGRELGIDQKTALKWLTILESSFQFMAIPSFSQNTVKKIASKPKGMFIDTGMVCGMLRISSPEVLLGHPMLGALFETFVFWEIYKTVQAWPTKPNFYHYRTQAMAEIDLIAEINGKYIPIEIKIKTNPNKGDVNLMSRFMKEYHSQCSIGIVVCSCEIPYKIKEDIWAIPWWMV